MISKSTICWTLVAAATGVVFPDAMARAAGPSTDVPIEAVKARAYPGGLDEEDLRVQLQILPPQRRLDAKAVQATVLKGTGRQEVNEDSAPPPSGPTDE